MKRIGVAVVGTGFIGPFHVEGLPRAAGTITGVLGSAPEKSLTVADTLGLARGYPNLAALPVDPGVRSVHPATAEPVPLRPGPRRPGGAGRTLVKGEAMDYSVRDIAKMIDHSLLMPVLTLDDLEKGCQLALEYNVASVCILPHYLKRCAQVLKGSTVKASTTIGFPHGGHTTVAKVAETKQALADGGEELDMVVNVSRVLSGDWDFARQDIKAVVDTAHAAGQKVKVIFENCYLKDEHKIRLCQISGELRADWVKTSTGFGTGGATLEDLVLMRKHSPASVQVKAAGGVRDLDMLLKVRALGVSRVGARSTKEILEEATRRLSVTPSV